MPVSNRPLSRRGLMKAAGIGALWMTASKALANPTDENMDEVRRLSARIPSDELDYVRGEVGKGGGDADDFEMLARVLWTNFRFGTQRVKVSDGIFREGYEYKSGAILLGYLKDEEFRPPTFEDFATSRCAYLCGHIAALRAIEVAKDGPPEVTTGVYRWAWDETKRQIDERLFAARKLSGKSRRDLARFAGMGC